MHAKQEQCSSSFLSIVVRVHLFHCAVQSRSRKTSLWPFFFSLSPNISHILPLQNSLNNSWNGSLNTSLNTSGGKVKVSCIHYHQWTVFDRAYCEGFPPTLLLTLFFVLQKEPFRRVRAEEIEINPKFNNSFEAKVIHCFFV